jgi:DNA-binding transcriptional LysR family regulator
LFGDKKVAAQRQLNNRGGGTVVNFEWYRSFIAVYQAGTVTAAADKRFLTQPTLSQHIAALEIALDTRLFERTARKMIPTDAARMLYPQVIASVERLEAIGHRPLSESSTRWVRIGAPITYFHEVALDQLGPLKRKKILIDVRFGETGRLMDGLSKGDLDIIILTQKLPMPHVHFVPLRLECFVLAGAAGMTLPKNSKGSLGTVERWLAKRDWIAFSSDLSIIRRYWQKVFRKRPDFRPSMIIPDLHGIVHAVAAGYGLSIIPSYLLNSVCGKLAVEEVWSAETRVVNHVFVACHQDRLRDPLIESVIDVLLTHGHNTTC